MSNREGTSFRSEVSDWSMYQRTATKSIGKMEVPKSVADLETSTSVSGKRMPSFEVLDSMVGSGVRKNLARKFREDNCQGPKAKH